MKVTPPAEEKRTESENLKPLYKYLAIYLKVDRLIVSTYLPVDIYLSIGGWMKYLSIYRQFVTGRSGRNISRCGVTFG